MSIGLAFERGCPEENGTIKHGGFLRTTGALVTSLRNDYGRTGELNLHT